MKKQISEETALGRVAALCSGSEHCEAEVRAKLDAWEIDAEAQKRIVAYLYKERFLDENRYANFFAHDKLRYNQWGRGKLRYMMCALQLPEEAIRQALEEIDDEEHEAVRQALIEKKNREIKDKDPYTRKAKLQRFLYSRGFSPDI